MLYIEVPLQEKDEIKALGAKWNPNRKSWYVEDYNDYLKFKKWIPKTKNGRAAVICISMWFQEEKFVNIVRIMELLLL